jgi:hypothetical protein
LCLCFLSVALFAQTAPQTTTVNNITVNGDMVVEDVTVTKDTLKALDHVVMQENLEVKKDINISGHINFGNGLGMRSFSATSTRPSVFRFAQSDVNAPNSSLRLLDIDETYANCLTPFFSPNANPIYSFYGNLRANGGNNGALNLGHDGANGIIDVDGAGISNESPGGLLINYYCERNVAICTGPTSPNSNANTNHVYIGDFLNARKHVEIGNPTYPTADANNVALDIHAVGGKGIRFNSNNASMPLLSINPLNTSVSPFTLYGSGQIDIGSFSSQASAGMLRIGQGVKSHPALEIVDNSNTASLKPIFKVMGNGYTEITVQSPNILPKPYGTTTERVFTIRDEASTKDLFAITKDGKVYAREVEINLVATFPDYVFAKDYKLKPLTEVEAFIKANQHLPNFEKGTHYEKNGINVNDLLLKQQQTIEELTLYIIGLEKRIKSLEVK